MSIYYIDGYRYIRAVMLRERTAGLAIVVALQGSFDYVDACALRASISFAQDDRFEERKH
jgi:hypothetical protein